MSLLKPAQTVRFFREKGLNWTTNTLKYFRMKDVGPPHIKIGGRIYYDQSQIEMWFQKEITK